MVEKKTDAIDRIAIDHIVKLRDRLVVERLRLFRLKRAIDAYARTVDSQLLSASRSNGPLARPRSCVAKPIRSEMPNRTPFGCERRQTIGHCGGEPGEGWRHANIEQ